MIGLSLAESPSARRVRVAALGLRLAAGLATPAGLATVVALPRSLQDLALGSAGSSDELRSLVVARAAGEVPGAVFGPRLSAERILRIASLAIS